MSLQAVILFAHGARDPRWAAPFESVAQEVRQMQPDAWVSLSFLEFMSPTLPEAVDMAVAHGAAQVHVVPLFLGAGGHVRKDLPSLLEGMRQRYPEVAFVLQPAVGESLGVIQAMAAAAVHGMNAASLKPS